MKRTIRAMLFTFAVTLARESAWRLAREAFRPKPGPMKPKRKKKKHGVS